MVDSSTPELAHDTRLALGQRARAAAIHLGLSFLVAAAAALLVFSLWYPSPYRDISGGRDLFLLVVIVDVVLGPLITFAIFDVRKRRAELQRDLLIVALLQLGALAYGLHAVYLARPVYLVFEVDRFRVVRAADLDQASLQRAAPAFRRLPVLGPELLAARAPTDPEEQLRSITLALAGVDIGLRPETWHPYADARGEVLARAKPLSAWRSRPDRRLAIEQAAARCGRDVERLGAIPMVARVSTWSAVVSLPEAAVCAYLPFGGLEAP